MMKCQRGGNHHARERTQVGRRSRSSSEGSKLNDDDESKVFPPFLFCSYSFLHCSSPLLISYNYDFFLKKKINYSLFIVLVFIFAALLFCFFVLNNSFFTLDPFFLLRFLCPSSCSLLRYSKLRIRAYINIW